ncbi:MAG: phosphopantetheine-binding protein [Chloroflexota bacterium]
MFEVPNNVNPDWQSLPIGQPLPNRSAYLLDDQGQPIQFEQPPYSESGELYLGGDSLARGYLNQPALTADKFIDNPFSEGKLYQTGDLARFLPKSILEYIGRKDNQVQIRGFRVELGEVETALQRHPLVEKAAVLAIGEAANKQLLAYLTLAQQTTVDNTPALDTPALDAPVINRAMLRQELSQTLPYYMVPQQYLVVETFPLTANGKIDRQALRTLDVVALPQNNQHDTFVPPATQWEQTLAEIIMAQLELDAVDVQTNFADLGLNSLHLTQLQNQIQTTFEQDIALVEIFNHPTIQALALHLSASDRLSVAKDQATGKQSRLPQTAAQAGGADRAANQRAYLQQRKRQQSKKHTRRRA